MDLKTFQAATMSEALSQVKSSMGPTAVILHTRTFRRHCWLGLRRREVVEITAGKGLSVPDRGSRRAMPVRSQVLVAANGKPAPLAVRPAPLAVRPAPQAGRQLLESPAGQGAAMLGLTEEISNIKSLVKDLVKQARQQRAPQVPEELFEFYTQLVDNEVEQELAAEIIKQLSRQLRPEHLRQGDFVREKLSELIERLLPASGPIVRSKAAGPQVVALIGPTGVGKTTTIAKLAANLRLREKRRIGLITIDTYRIAAIDQLRKYADIIGSPLRVTASPEELREAVASMRDQDFILIDTAGRSPNDALKLSELKTFLSAANPDEVHLVLATTASQDCVELALSRFSEVRGDKIIFTKLDEAAHLGVILNVVHKLNKSLSYVTTGQDVPDDIEVGRGRRLARMILGMEKESRS